jgi:purine-binding chemotaxis protein CheW
VSTAGEHAAGTLAVVVFEVAGARFGLELSVVERVIRAVAVRAVEDLPAAVEGVIDVHGDVVPVFNLRRRVRLPERAIAPDEQFLLARAASRRVALVVDRVEGIREFPADQILPRANIAEGAAGLVSGVVSGAGGVVVIHDLERFLSGEEDEQLGRALAREREVRA